MTETDALAALWREAFPKLRANEVDPSS